MKNYEYVQNGFKILHPTMSGFIGMQLYKKYHDNWWVEVENALNDQWDLLPGGTYAQLVDSLDIANCIRLIDRKWFDVFKNVLPLNSRNYAKELMGVRNAVAHIGTKDFENEYAERAIQTMYFLCKSMDEDEADKIKSLYIEIVSINWGIDKETKPMPGVISGPSPIDVKVEPPKFVSPEDIESKTLLELVDTDAVQRTTLTRKVTFNNETKAYPVYKVRLDALYYNDQNDRIASWISKYEAENDVNALSELSGDEYNNIIEEFIYESNPESIHKTQKNISVVGQREPGVTLSDGRIVDGNRRYTCLRRIRRESSEPIYFETVIMDMDIQRNKKQIKLLELAIQHGEEKKVDYDLIDYAIGTYRDIVQTNLLTVEEYAESTNESVAEVKKRIEIIGIVSEFLNYLKLPEQYYIAREYQVYDVFNEMLPSLKQLDENEKACLKTITFNNALMKAIPDQRKFIRDIKNLIKNNAYTAYFDEQKEIAERISKEFKEVEAKTKADLDRFAAVHEDIVGKMQLSMEKALLSARTLILKSKPIENVSKSKMLMSEIDSRLFAKMDEEEKENLKAELEELRKITNKFLSLLSR